MTIVTSLVINLAIELLEIDIPHGIHGGAVSLILSLTLFFGISLFSPPPKLGKDVEAIMDL